MATHSRPSTTSQLQFGQERRHGIAVSAVTMALLTIVMTLPEARSASVPADQLPALQDPPLTQYRAFRRMHAHNEKFNQEAWLDAWTELDGRSFRYEITSERGSDYIRSKVLKAILSHEQELVAKGEACRGELSPENYQFEEAAQSGDVRY